MLHRLAGLVVPAALTSLALLGCSASQSKEARAQDSARELNLNARFGRNELVVERVAPAERAAYAIAHRSWGGQVRIADSELAGFSMTPKDEALVIVKVAWYRQDEQELRITTMRQRYKDFKGDWMLVAEERLEGDVGLLGETVPAVPADATPRRSAQFPTIRLSE